MKPGGKLATSPRCPSCQSLLDGYTHSSFNRSIHPRKGDFSLCTYCCVILEFHGNPLTLRISSEEVKLEALKHPEFQKVYRLALIKKIVEVELKHNVPYALH